MSEILLVLRVIMVFILYAFLGWAFLTLWRDLKHQREILSVQKAPMIELEIQIGDTLQKLKYHGPEITIGRDPSCECPLDSGTVSANHARISFYKNQWWVEDLESTNGTFLNNERVSAPPGIAHKDQLRCGEVLLTILSEL